MIVERMTQRYLPGHLTAAAELLQEARAKWGAGRTIRIYAPNIGPHGVLVYESEFPDLASRERGWEVFWAHPDTPAFMERWNKVCTLESMEIWNLLD